MFVHRQVPAVSSPPILLRCSRFDVVAIDLPGRDGQLHRREYISHPGAVVLLALVDADTVVCIENDRPAVGETLLELPAGTCEPGEPVLETAARELIEETGYSAGRLTSLFEFFSAPGLGNERMHLVVATDLIAGTQQLETTERITTRLIRRPEIRELVRTHQIRDAKTLIGLQAFLHQELEPR